MIRLILLITLTSCAHKPVEKNKESKTSVQIQTAIDLARTGFIRSCIQAHKYHAPKKKWGKHCKKEAQIYVEEIHQFLK